MNKSCLLKATDLTRVSPIAEMNKTVMFEMYSMSCQNKYTLENMFVSQ